MHCTEHHTQGGAGETVPRGALDRYRRRVGIFLVTAPSSRIARKASFPNRSGRHRARGRAMP